MLTELDDLLCHQTAATFDEVAVTDHRFFDRTWFCAYAPDGGTCVITGMGAYANTNVLDGFAAVQRDGVQWNVRLSRGLRPRRTLMAVGPLAHEVEVPLSTFRLTLEPGEHDVSFDLRWTGAVPPTLEGRHQATLDGRGVEDYRRFVQLGTVDGSIEVDGHRTELDGWFGARDRSWGVRRGVGGFEPFTGTLPAELTDGVLFFWLAFTSGGVAGQLQLKEDGAGTRIVTDGTIVSEGSTDAVVAVEHDLELVPGTRVLRRGTLAVTTASGAEHEIEVTPSARPWAYVGTGYDGGYADGRGLGVFRGASLVEHDRYTLTDHEDVILPDGRTVRPIHREQPALVRVDGRPGTAHSACIVVGPSRLADQEVA